MPFPPANPTSRWFIRTQSFGSAVPLGVLGEGFLGTVVADFYSGYGPLMRRRQRCGMHLLRDLEHSAAEHPEEPGVRTFCKGVRRL